MSVSQLNRFSQLLERVYSSLWSPDGMDGALMALKDYFHCCSATLVSIQNNPRQIIYGWSVGIPENHGQRYIENNWIAKDIAIDYFAAESPKQQSFVASSQLLHDMPLVEVVTDEFKPWLRDEEIVDTCGYILDQGEHESQLISFQRNKNMGQFSKADLEQMNLIVPHVKQCVGLFNNFHQQQIKSDTLQAAINSLQLPTLVLNNLLQVIQANPAAEIFLQQHPVMSLQNKQLIMQDEDIHHEYIFQACKQVSYRTNEQEESKHTILTIPCEKGEIQLSLSPMFATEEKGSHKKGLLVQCYLIEKKSELTIEKIQQAYNVSKAEAEVCLLLALGRSVADISDVRKVSINTVREQIRSIFKKTPYSRQGELITALLNL